MEPLSQDWVTFFSTQAAVCATAFGVLFVVLQLKAGAWQGQPTKRAAAVSAMTELLVPMIAALVSLIDGNPWRWAAGTTGVFGLGVIAWGWLVYFSEKRDPDAPNKPDDFDRNQAWLSLISLCVYGTMVVTSLLGGNTALTVYAVVAIWLIFSGTTEAWWLLLETSGKSMLFSQSNRTPDVVRRFRLVLSRSTDSVTSTEVTAEESAS